MEAIEIENNNKSNDTKANSAEKRKTPAKRNVWSATEEKQFLILCRDKAIAEMLDNCLTTAGNEEVYSYIRDGLAEKGFKRRDIEKIRQKHRKLKMKFNDIKDHNLHATGRSRKEWIHLDLAEQVWGFRPASSKTILDTDDDENFILNDDTENTSEVANVESVDTENPDEPVPKKSKTGDSKVVVKFQPGKSKLLKKQTEAKIMADSEKYFVDQMVVLEEKRMNQQMQLETQRLEAEKGTREANLQIQRDMMHMMLQMHKLHSNLNYHKTFTLKFNCN